MKIRNDFVTNSSSSSFIVDQKDVSFGKLIKAILEIANTEYDYLWNEDEGEFDQQTKKKKKYKLKNMDFCTEYDEEWLRIAPNFYLRRATTDNPVEVNLQYGNYSADEIDKLKLEGYSEEQIIKIKSGIMIYNHHYVVDNLGEIRYDFGLIKEIMDKYNIPYVDGYCD